MYKKIVALSEPYYKKGRPGDTDHIKWLSSRLFDLEEIIKKKGYDFDIIFALTVLHDVGYAKLHKGYNPFDLKIRKLHAEKSAEVAEEIFEKVNFLKSKRKKTLRLIKHHDDWAFNKPLKDAEWRIFTDLDFAWEASKKGFDIVRKFLNQTRKEFLNTVKDDYKKKQKKYPFFLDKSKQLFLQDLRYWKRKLTTGQQN
tara:strand:+ start:54 stop:647 length:594 start_codon:yes stop_codon:yes gene_type:complete